MSTGSRPHFRLHGRMEEQRLIFDLGPGTHRVGSRRESDLRLPFPGVSREHAILRVSPEGLTVEDRGSKNGTLVEGTRIRRAALLDGSTVVFGSVPLSVEQIGAGDALAIAFSNPAHSTAAGRTHFETASWEAVMVQEEQTGAACRKLVFPDGYRVGTSAPLRDLYRLLAPLAQGDLPILIVGETGVGKEAVARILHASSRRAAGPLVTVNCAAVPGELLEAELFGIVRGTATGVEPRRGLFAQAEGGTLFLDEVAEMPRNLQPKLLRALQDGEIRPLGGTARAVDVRIVAATNAAGSADGSGGLRQDLFFRLAGATVEVPPLRRCRDEIPGLVAHFLEGFSARERIPLRGLTANALERLRAYGWPGNVRELEQEMHRLVLAVGEGAIVDREALAPKIREAPPEMDRIPAEMDSLALAPRLENLEKALLKEAMLRAGGRLAEAARLLEIHRNSLANKLKRFGIRHSWAEPEDAARKRQS